jgi:hypothetical protein
MTPSDFADFDDDLFQEFDSGSEPYEQYLNVRGLLCTRYGKEMGNEIYALLLKHATEASEHAPAQAEPGILFTEDGGEFVGFESAKDAEF